MTWFGRITLAAAVALPPALVALASTTLEPRERWLAIGVAVAVSIALSCSFDAALRRRLLTLSSVLAAYREGDFSIRARRVGSDELLADVIDELNLLGDAFRAHRLGELEAWALLRKVMAEVDVVVIAIDDDKTIRLANDAAARVLGKPDRELIGASAGALDLAELLGGDVPRIVTLGGVGPWELRRGAFRLSGEPHVLLVLSDVSRALRDNERDAWRRLIRVIGHEINNSLSPIASISQSLRTIVTPATRSADWESDLESGLAVIGRRAEALARFMSAYATLARLPPPRRARVDVAALLGKVAALETRVSVDVSEGPSVTVLADADQLEQALINLVKNAAEAVLPSKRGVRLHWEEDVAGLAIVVEDDGPGVSETANLFVPFFTTKAGGSGIGLVLSRQIVEAHGGRLSLASGPDGRGARARVWLPR